ncbi:MAG: hypothetical protein M1833_003524 [Piccolia ochrophora]|nr:MAG: hypothetical protein M1833_003524 [Piccolia ochrophora]
MSAEQKSTGLLDLEKELSCSICADVLYQPLTLLDCLHTFCGSCLKEWFSWQALHPSATHPYSCPSCRAQVRETRPNATVTTLLDMFLQANPGRAKSQVDKDEIAKAYKPGDNVLPPVRSTGEDSMGEEDRRLIAEVREMSLREVEARQRRPTSQDRTRGQRHTEDHHRRRREEDQRARTNGESLGSRETGSRTSQGRSPRTNIGHQSSLRSLISTSDADPSEMEEEIMRQITDEGLLDGIDLSRINVTQEDEISEWIAAAYRERQRDRGRPGARRRSDSGNSHLSADPGMEHRRGVDHTRSRSAIVGARQSSRGPNAAQSQRSSDVGVEGHNRPSSNERRQTTPISHPTTETRSRDGGRTIRAATQPSPLTQSSLLARSDIDSPPDGRATVQTSSHRSAEQGPSRRHAARSADNAARPESRQREATGQLNSMSDTGPANSARTTSPPSSIRSPQTSPRIDGQHQRDTLVPPTTASGSSRNRASLYPEPSVSCERCKKSHIEYELHYNCFQCKGGAFNLCLDCYRAGRGCLHWYGFGYVAWMKYEREAPENGYPPNHPLPHSLKGRRYLHPRQNTIQPAASDSSRQPLTAEDPRKRLQAGSFCSICGSFASQCFWKCDVCNDGGWGYCSSCVNTGRHCTHPLVPFLDIPSASDNDVSSNNLATAAAQLPPSTSLLRGPGIVDHGSLKPLSIATACNVCHLPIQPSSTRFHCYMCNDGDYDICTPCYLKITAAGKISSINGPRGWRRCFRGHRMVIVGFEDSDGERRRRVVRDLVGGLALRDDEAPETSVANAESINATNSPDDTPQHPKWWWKDSPEGERRSRMIDRPSVSSPPSDATASLPSQLRFPPDGGVGLRVLAKYSWYPAEGVTDELLFPRGAEIREVEDINGDYFWGVYAGAKGLFPGAYVKILKEQH